MKTMTEASARRAVYTRSGGVCEACLSRRATEWHHRKNRSQGGPWSPENGLHLCSACHAWITAHPEAAVAVGWAVRGHADPAQVPVYLGGRRQVLLTVEGTYAEIAAGAAA